MRRIISGAAFSLSVVLGAALGAAAVPAAASAAYSSCASGYVCFYTEQNGGGSKCSWYSDDPDWTTGSIQCSWATTSNVRSIANMGTSKSYVGVAYYSGANYNTRMGCTRQGSSGNLRGDYKLRSHKWLATGQTCG